MITSLYIKNYILIDELRLDFKDGFTVFTGETGAGKSIVINAIDIALGSKPQKSVVKEGKDKAFIELCVKLPENFDKSIFEDEGIDIEDDEITVSAEISNSFRRRVNGVCVSKNFMSDLREKIVDIHSQNQTYTYISKKSHINLLDNFSGKSHLEKLSEYKNLYELKNQTEKALELEKQKAAEALNQKEFLEFQLEELNAAQIEDFDEDQKIAEEVEFLSKAENLKELSYGAYYGILGEDGCVLDALSTVKSNISKLSREDKNAEDFESEIENCYEMLKDLGRSLRDYSERCEIDEERINSLQERASVLNKIKRKYGGTLESAAAARDDIDKKLNEFEMSESEIVRLEELLREIGEKLQTISDELSSTRKKNAEKLGKMLTEELQSLELKNSVFEIHVDEIPLNSNGKDDVEFYISTNVSMKPAPLEKCASGGEISRIVLALKAVFADCDKTDTVIFDETDTGISGKASIAVGRKMRDISKFHQVILITHQALTAAKAHNHFYVSKKQADKTEVSIEALDETGRIDALARLAGGKSDETTKEFARSLLSKNV